MKNLDDAVALADAMVKIGTMAGKHTSAVITNMSIPTDPLYYGCSGVTFTVDAYDGSVMTLKGDSDPIGCVKLTFTAVKN